MPPPDHDELAPALARALAPAFAGEPERARALGVELAARVSRPDAAEASLRVASGVVRGGRMMLERTDASVARRVASGLSLPWTARCEALVEACEALSLPLITGWDVGGPPLYKLYANASDASDALRRELARRVALPEGLPAPWVVGANVGAAGARLKLYVQHATPADIHEADLPPALSAIEAVAFVASFDVVDGRASLRAVFAATRHGREGSAEAALLELAGVAWPALEASFPYAPGPLRQIGWAPSGEVTVYAKRRGAAPPVYALAPTAVFRAGAVEVGLYLEPRRDGVRAFVRTERHALSFRDREGMASPAELEALGRWAAEQVSRAERERSGPDLSSPPAPWSRVP